MFEKIKKEDKKAILTEDYGLFDSSVSISLSWS